MTSIVKKESFYFREQIANLSKIFRNFTFKNDPNKNLFFLFFVE